jgi:FAD/FMN-containing dehydrogenase
MVVHPGTAFKPGTLAFDADVRDAYAEDASPLRGAPEAVARPDSANDVVALLVEAAARGIPVTPCGLRSSTTGAGLAPRGWTLSTERLTGVVDIDVPRRRAIVAAGTVLREAKDLLETHGLFYPPDPTSERECAIGGTVACDASGARTYRYGPTHRWVRGVEVAGLDGTLRWYRRREVDKDAAGPAALRDPVGWFCGSEGMFGVITKVEVELLPLPVGFLAGMAFFDDLASALRFVGAARAADRRTAGPHPRCLELLDRAALDIMAAVGSGIPIPGEAGACIFFEEEHGEEGSDALLPGWWSLLQSIPGARPDDTAIAVDRAQQDVFRRLRHAVPSRLNEEGRAAASEGGKKVSTDWAVPFEQLLPFMERVDGWLREADLGRVSRYGHVGNGHPHYNIIVRNREEAALASGIVDRMCAEACALGGTISAEHGIGKLKRPYARHRFSDTELAMLRAMKSIFDPRGLLAPGNLFPDER